MVDPKMVKITPLLLTGWAALALPAQAQDLLRLDDFEECATCTLTPRPVLRLGSADGPGVIESKYAELVWARGRGLILYLPRVGENVHLFDEAGDYVESMGGPGEGPGELRGVHQPAFWGANGVLVLDAGGKWIRFGAGGQVVEERRHDGPGGPFHLEQGDTTAVLFGLHRTREAAGYPLHRVDLRTGRVMHRFGSRNSTTWSLRDFYNHRVLAGKSDRSATSVWWGTMGRPHFEEWTLDGRLRRVVTGELDWLFGDLGRGSPRTLVAEFGVDGSDRLWLLTWVPDRRWREVPRGLEGSVSRENYDRYRDARLDVFDLRTGRHVGSHSWDQTAVKLLRRGSEIFIYLMEFVTPDWPRMAIYAVDFSTTTQGR